MIRKTDQLSFGMLDDRIRPQKRTMLEEINAMIDFAPIERLLETMYSKTQGRPAIPPIMLFKMLLLEQWYGLSDVEVVLEVHDRRSFERFVGEDVRNYTVDDSTLVVFRQRMRTHKVIDAVFALFRTQLEARNLFVREGTIVDSTLVQGATKPGRKRASGEPVDGDVQAVPSKGFIRDGYKVHIGMDQGSELIETVALTQNTVADITMLRPMVPPGTRAVFADKGYSSAAHRRWLRGRRIKSRIMHRAARAHPLTEQQERANRQWSPVRAAIERKMNDLKRWCHLSRLRYYGLERNYLQVVCAAIAANLKRSRVLIAAQMAEAPAR